MKLRPKIQTGISNLEPGIKMRKRRNMKTMRKKRVRNILIEA
jgi:hypothetical protein